MSEKIYNTVELETIEKLADIVTKKELGEITIVDGEKAITIKGRKCPPPPVGLPSAIPFAAQQSAQTDAQPANNAAAAAYDGNVVKSPIVGTFYAASAPDKPPFVSVGSAVKKGDVLMIIESMKLMNEVQSDFDGTVTEILVGNGQAVEFDQPIMIIK